MTHRARLFLFLAALCGSVSLLAQGPVTVTLTSPPAGVITGPVVVPLAAVVSPVPSGPLTVTFWNGATLLGSVSAPPYTLTWTSPAGPLELELTARAEFATTVVSEPVAVLVAPPASAVFGAVDTTTKGNWRGKYGTQGFRVPNDVTQDPASVQVMVGSASTCVWAATTNDLRALQRAGTVAGRRAACWYSGSAFTIDVNLTDGAAHKVSVYLLNWEGAARAQRLEVLHAETGAVLDTRTVTGYQGGQYLSWTLTGHVRLRITNTGYPNAVVSGLFFDPVTPAPPQPPPVPPPVVVVPPGSVPPALAGLRLIQKADFDAGYLGAFRLPAVPSPFPSTPPWNGSRFGYGALALAFNPAGNSVFLTGHETVPVGKLVAEVTIPELRKDVPEAGLARATFVQSFGDPTDGQRLALGNDYARIGGLLPWGDKLLTAVYHWYDANGTQPASHFVSGLRLDIQNDTRGPYKVGALKVGFTSGYMAPIPPAWRTVLGGSALTGNCCISILSRTSFGPAAFAFNPDDVGVLDPVPASPLVYYPTDASSMGALPGGYTVQNEYFNGTTKIGGVVFPDGTRSVLFFGIHGTGPFCYGVKCFPGAGQAPHAAPYRLQVWAYDALDLAAVRAGTKLPQDVTPYAIWAFTLPFDDGQGIQGATYDPLTRRIFLSQRRGENPLVHVFTVQVP